MRSPKNNYGYPLFLLLGIPLQVNFGEYAWLIRAIIMAVIAVVLFLIYVRQTRKNKPE